MNLEEIKKLAKLSRLEMDDSELEEIAKDFGAILAYVGQAQDALKLKNNTSQDGLESKSRVKNVMREDIPRNKPDFYANKIIEEMPETKGRFMKVKQIL